METNKDIKQYDFTGLNNFFNTFMTPEQLMGELVELAFSYSEGVDEHNVDEFKNNMGTIYVIYDVLRNVK